MHVGIVEDDEAESTTASTTEGTTRREVNIAREEGIVTEPVIEIIPVDETEDVVQIDRIIDDENRKSLTEATRNDLLNDTFAERTSNETEHNTATDTGTNVTSEGMVVETMMNPLSNDNITETIINSRQYVTGDRKLTNATLQENITELIAGGMQQGGNIRTFTNVTTDGNSAESTVDSSSNNTAAKVMDDFMDPENMTRPMENALPVSSKNPMLPNTTATVREGTDSTAPILGHETAGESVGHEGNRNEGTESDTSTNALHPDDTSHDNEEADMEKAAATTTIEDTSTTIVDMEQETAVATEDSELLNDLENEYVTVDDYKDMTETTIAPESIDLESIPDISEEANEVSRIMDGLGSASSMSTVTTARYDSLLSSVAIYLSSSH